jgi:HSP20 family molecular chaperone IbpA
MASAGEWLGALRQLPRRAFDWLPAGARISIHTDSALTPARGCRRPQLCIVEHERKVEFALCVPGAVAHSTRICWDEAARILTVSAADRGSDWLVPRADADTRVPAHWYAEVQLGDDLDGNRAEAYLKDGGLRIFVPRVDTRPLTGLPLFAWAEESAPWEILPAT